MADFIQIQVTIPDKKTVKQLCSLLLNKRLACDFQVIGPIKSTYWWKNKIETAKEWLCLLKTKKSNFKTIETEIKKIHPYEVPQIISVPLIDGSQDYLNWIHTEVI